MKLTDQERNYIARRANGEYAIIPAVRRVVRAHQKNRNLADQVFLDFARLILQKSWNWDDYERLALLVMELEPEPWGPIRIHDLPEEDSEDSEEPPKATPKKRRRKCGICSVEGHNARTCPEKPDTPTVIHTDGIERLTPGFDPNPPKRVEDPHE